ncbi:MAG: DUF4405 domain-containing protein [Campylobacterales bacterium]|nr:DUF4405 domain-containing protein [Campylobacterales bacterium]
MKLKKITSLVMLWAMIVMSFTGIMLFVAPPGRVANWANWELLGMSKEFYGQLHTTFMVLFMIATILHIYYNWKPLISYLKNQAKKLIIFTQEMVAATIITLVFIVGTAYEITPFSNFLNFGEEVRESWEQDYGTAPYSHAELSSLESFCKKLGYDLEHSKAILAQNNMNFTITQSLSQIAKDNSTSPKAIYDILKNKLETKETKSIELSGLGKKKIKEVAQTLGISTNEFLKQLQTVGIKANEEDKFKEALEKYNQSPLDVMGKLGYHKPQ